MVVLTFLTQLLKRMLASHYNVALKASPLKSGKGIMRTKNLKCRKKRGHKDING